MKRYGPLGIEIQKHLKSLSWSQRELARKSGITAGTISKIMRGEHRATPDTITAIAKVLGLDPLFLMNVAGIPIPLGISDPAIDYIVQQLSKLPKLKRVVATQALRSQVDAFHFLMGEYEGVRQEEPQQELPRNPKISKLMERIEAMEETIKDDKSLERAINLLDSQLEILELAAKK
jgi:transcriptional regulator with XRE-family HTH domain